MYQNQKKYSLNSLGLRIQQKDRLSKNNQQKRFKAKPKNSNSLQKIQLSTKNICDESQQETKKNNPLKKMINFKSNNKNFEQQSNSITQHSKKLREKQIPENQSCQYQTNSSQKNLILNPLQRDVSTDHTMQKFSNSTQQRMANDSFQNNLYSKREENNGSFQISVKEKKLKNAEVGSVYSKCSNASKRKYLRPVSLNNNEHLQNLYQKQVKIFDENQNLVKNFSQKLNLIQQNVVLNIQNNFKQKVDQVWMSYIKDQQNKQINVDFDQLNRDVECIKNIFLEQTKLKTQHFLNQLKLQKFKEIYDKIEDNNNAVHYLDEDVGYLMNNKFKEVSSKKEQKQKELQMLRSKFQEEIDQYKQQLQQSQAIKQQVYDQEFCYKLQQDQKLVNKTLNSALNFLHNKIGRVDHKINKLKQKSQSSDFQALKNQVHLLQMEINQIKFANQFNNYNEFQIEISSAFVTGSNIRQNLNQIQNFLQLFFRKNSLLIVFSFFVLGWV